MLEHFANTSAPSKPVTGQLWYDSATANKNFKYYDGAAWVGLDGGLKRLTIKDTGGTDKEVITMGTNGVLVAVISPYDSFNVSSTDTDSAAVYAKFPTMKKGINLQSGTGGGSDEFKLHGTATTAEYADLAELYSSDQEYEPGTVLMIGGEAEVTQTTEAFSGEVFGIVSTNPAYLMNSAMEGTSVPVALEGRLPCKVIGPVRKGQRIVSSEEPGVARAVSDYEKQEALDWYRIVGRALANKDSEGVELVEVVVGVK